MQKKLSLFLLVFFVLAFSVFAQIEKGEAKQLSPCSSGGLTTSVHKMFQMVYTNEEFIQINDIDLLKDASQLKDLTCLQYMDATDRTITGDIAGLKNLVNLEVFSLYSNPEVYGDICSLAGAKNLRVLKFAFDPKITGNISCLKDLTKLETFAMTHTQIYGDLSVFANMPNLKAIYVSGTNVSGNICAFGKLTNLEEFGIADEYPGNPDITGDLSCLDNLQKLKRVSIYNTGTTNCEQFTKSHPNIAQMGQTESGRPAGGGCSKESLKTLVDVAQKYERKIGKEVQTEVRGKPDYNKPDEGPPEECIVDGKFIGEAKCRDMMEKPPSEQKDEINKIERDGKDSKQEQALQASVNKENIFVRFFRWLINLFRNEPVSSSDANRQPARSQGQDRGQPEECFTDGKFIGEAECKAMMEKAPEKAPDRGPPKDCIIDGKFIGEEKCREMMEKGGSGKVPLGNAPEGRDGGPPEECTIDGKFIGKEKCRAMMEKGGSDG